MPQFVGAPRKGAALAIGGLTVALLLAACGPQAASTPSPTPNPPTATVVSADTVKRGDVQQTLALSGEVRAREQISVMPKASGRIENLL